MKIHFLHLHRMITCSLCAHAVPDVAVEVIVAGQQEPTGLAERHACDPADYVVVAVHAQLLDNIYCLDFHH